MDNSIAKMRPELVSEWSPKNLPLTPDKVPFGSNKQYWWIGICGHEWQTSAKARSHGENCPICSNARIIPGVNDLESLYPELAKEWSPQNTSLPSEVGPGSHKKAVWNGSCGHTWTCEIRARVRGTGCPYCSHNKVLPGFNDLATLFPEVAHEWSPRNLPLLPSHVTAFANKKVWWRCSKGHEWFTLISIRSDGSKCPYCSGIKTLKGFNDFATTHPNLVKEWSERNGELKPDMVNAKSSKNVWWKCSTCGYEWKSVIRARVRGTVCPVCADRAVLKGYNDLATTDKALLEEWDYEKNKLNPDSISRGTYKRAWWICRHGHSWNSKICERTIEGISCKTCEAEFNQLLLQLLIIYYAGQSKLRTEIHTDKAIGLPVETYIPELQVIVEHRDKSKIRTAVKKDMCCTNGIDYYEIDGSDPVEIANKIKAIFRRHHIFIKSNAAEDIKICREKFFAWKEKR